MSSDRAVICLLGQPATGKTTIATRAARSRGCSVFRFRDAAREAAVVDVHVARALKTTADPLGWVDDDTAARVLAAHLPGGHDPLIIENFPGSAAQVHLLGRALQARGSGSRVAAIELVLPLEELERRADARRVCPVCEPDPVNDPHIPAIAAADDPERCARCGGRLSWRGSDRADIRAERRRRYNARRPAIVEAFEARGWAWHSTDARYAAPDVAAAVVAAIDRLT